MTNKETIIKYISEMNINMLSLILNDNISYMDLTKEDFLKKIAAIFSNCKINDASKFTSVCRGYCVGECENVGEEGFNFSGKGIGNLSLLFEEDEGKVIDICKCSVFETDDKRDVSWSLSMHVYDDEKVGFIPSFEQMTLMNKLSSFHEQFNEFKGEITDVVDFYPLIKECEGFYHKLDWGYKFNLKFVNDFFELWSANSFVIDLVELNDLAIAAMKEFNEIDLLDERALVKWLLKYDDTCFLFDFKKLDNWETNHFLVPTKFETVVLDCTNYVAALQLSETHHKYNVDVMLRYQPTEEHEKIAGDQVITHSLSSLLTWHMKYLDLLPNDVQIISENFKKSDFPPHLFDE